LLAAAQTLLRRALSRPEARGRAARGLRVSVEMEDGRIWKREATFREPVSSEARMLLAIRPKIEAGVGEGSASGVPAPFVEVELVLLDLCGESAVQGKLFGQQAGAGSLDRTSERLAAAARQLKVRYGRPVLAKVMEVEPWSRIPERRFALIDYDP
jgi:DNA polymerase-4/protein ImuB